MIHTTETVADMIYATELEVDIIHTIVCAGDLYLNDFFQISQRQTVEWNR